MTRPHVVPSMRLLLLVLCALPVAAQGLAGLDAAVMEELAKGRVPGAVLGIVRDGKLLHAKAYGLASVDPEQPVKPEMLFRLGSTTKVMTAAALAKLAAEGKADLDAPVRKYVPELPERLGAVTLHQLLSHTAGIRDEASMAGSHDDAALEKYVLGWKDDWLFTAPGKVLSYSNPGYHLAGLVLARITGKTYADAMRHVLFAPLGMKRTTLRPLEAMTWPLAQGHEVAGGKAVVIRPAADDASNWPAGSVFTNLEDMAKFAGALAQGGAEGLPKAAVDLLTSRPAAVPGNRTRYGYGLILVDWRGIPLWNHGGARAGYGSTISIAPEQKVAVFAIGNRTGAGMQGAVEKAMELMLQPQVLVVQRDPGRKEEADGAFAARVAGRYRNGGMVVQLVSEAGKLTARLDGRTFAAQKLGVDRVALEKGPELILLDGAGGGVEYVCFSLRCAARVE